MRCVNPPINDIKGKQTPNYVNIFVNVSCLQLFALFMASVKPIAAQPVCVAFLCMRAYVIRARFFIFFSFVARWLHSLR